jgi:hypothetical protein
MNKPHRRNLRKIPEHNPIKRFYAKPTWKNAVIAQCAYCMGCSAREQGNGFEDHLEPTFAKQIRNCSAPHCPLFKFRPFQSP